MNDNTRSDPPDWSNPPDWSGHYASGETPWDLGGPHPELSAELQRGALTPPHEGAHALVPGAGRGHDALALARRGWNVTALDVVEELASTVGRELSRQGGRYVIGDALAFESAEPFDLVWDHTFFCAIDPRDRARWGLRARDLVKANGRYTALVFPVGKPRTEGGPPHGMDDRAVCDALGPHFRTVEARAVRRAVAQRTWRERWLLLERTAIDARR